MPPDKENSSSKYSVSSTLELPEQEIFLSSVRGLRKEWPLGITLEDLEPKIVCDWCRLKIGCWRRQNTQYNDDRQNWVFLCDNCNEENEGYWAAMWKEYYGGL
jgi:hypothetical protein